MKKLGAVLCLILLAGCAVLDREDVLLAQKDIDAAKRQNELTAKEVRTYLEGNIQDIREWVPEVAEARGLPPDAGDAILRKHEGAKLRVETSLQAMERGTDLLGDAAILLGKEGTE